MNSVSVISEESEEEDWDTYDQKCQLFQDAVNKIDFEDFSIWGIKKERVSSKDLLKSLTKDFKHKMTTKEGEINYSSSDSEKPVQLSNKRNIKFYRKELERGIKTKFNSTVIS